MTDTPDIPGLSDNAGFPEDTGIPDGTGGLIPPTSPNGDPLLCGLDDLAPVVEGSRGFRMPLHDQVLELGAPEADLDGDGFLEAITLQDERGVTVYTDVDGDRAIDQVTTVRFDGTYDTWQLTNAAKATAFGGFTGNPETTIAGSPRWECTDFGKL